MTPPNGRKRKEIWSKGGGKVDMLLRSGEMKGRMMGMAVEAERKERWKMKGGRSK